MGEARALLDSLATPALVEQTPRINGTSKVPSKDR